MARRSICGPTGDSPRGCRWRAGRVRDARSRTSGRTVRTSPPPETFIHDAPVGSPSDGFSFVGEGRMAPHAYPRHRTTSCDETSVVSLEVGGVSSAPRCLLGRRTSDGVPRDRDADPDPRTVRAWSRKSPRAPMRSSACLCPGAGGSLCRRCVLRRDCRDVTGSFATALLRGPRRERSACLASRWWRNYLEGITRPVFLIRRTATSGGCCH